MAKYFGGLVVLAYAAMAFSGYEPFTTERRGATPGESRRGRVGGAYFGGGTGYWGGK